MEEQNLLKKQFMLHILYNMIAFALIFSVFRKLYVLDGQSYHIFNS